MSTVPSAPRTARVRVPAWTSWIILMVVFCLFVGSACDKPECDLTGHKVTTRVAISHIGTPSRLFEVQISGFHPNATMNLSIINFPKSADISETVTLNASGALTWTKNAPLLLTTDPSFEPTVDVTTTVAETATKCLSIAKTKHQEFARI